MARELVWLENNFFAAWPAVCATGSCLVRALPSQAVRLPQSRKLSRSTNATPSFRDGRVNAVLEARVFLGLITKPLSPQHA
jgi:hypothetical protein